MMKNICLFIFLLCTFAISATAQLYELSSPGGNLRFSLQVGDSMTYTVYAGTKRLIKPSSIGLELYSGYRTADHAEIKNTSRSEVHGIIPVLNGKNTEIREDYKELVLEMDSFSLIVRAYDEGIAYRFKTRFSGEITVKSETAEFNFEGDPDIWFGEAEPEMIQWERSYYPYASIG
ncbi:MAG TPA: glycoside hydrolase family 97 N-terminal domain-containing protein, partial [Bacteroidales bacterium]|nr:glycoside hydrolase family 97 N-terminal domain-containing protein [Bacteroidales bacterium]